MNRLQQLLIQHESLELKPYQDSEGKWTIGVGRNLDDVGISENEALILLSNDIKRCEQEARQFPWFKYLTEVRQDVILSMLFNLGLKRFNGFKKFKSAILKGDYKAAATEMLDSKWAGQVKGRANALAKMMETSTYPDLI